MFSQLSKTLTAGALAATIAVTGISATATPAAANGHRNNGAEAAAVFGGLLLLYGIANANNGQGNLSISGHGHRPRVQAPHVPRHLHNLRVAPSRCLIQGHSRGRAVQGYGRRCMQNHAAAAHLLPASCLRAIRTNRGHREVYSGRCLSNNGWTRG